MGSFQLYHLFWLKAYCVSNSKMQNWSASLPCHHNFYFQAKKMDPNALTLNA